jgi:DNA-binding PadR family transcriptional regulator
MERKGYLASVEEKDGRQTRRFYSATELGKLRLEDAKHKVQELFGELFEDADS